METLVLQNALHTIKTLVIVAVGLNMIVLIVGLISYFSGGKFDAKWN